MRTSAQVKLYHHPFSRCHQNPNSISNILHESSDDDSVPFTSEPRHALPNQSDTDTTIPYAESDLSDQNDNQTLLIPQREHRLPKKFSDFVMN